MLLVHTAQSQASQQLFQRVVEQKKFKSLIVPLEKYEKSFYLATHTHTLNMHILRYV